MRKEYKGKTFLSARHQQNSQKPLALPPIFLPSSPSQPDTSPRNKVSRDNCTLLSCSRRPRGFFLNPLLSRPSRRLRLLAERTAKSRTRSSGNRRDLRPEPDRNFGESIRKWSLLKRFGRSARNLRMKPFQVGLVAGNGDRTTCERSRSFGKRCNFRPMGLKFCRKKIEAILCNLDASIAFMRPSFAIRRDIERWTYRPTRTCSFLERVSESAS